MFNKHYLFYIYIIFVNNNIGDNMNFSDLMIEADDLNSNGNVVNISKKNGINITDVVNDDGIYLTMEFSDIIDNNIKKVFNDCFSKILRKNNINKSKSVLVVGLGNDKSTPDSLGPRVIDNIIVTRHMDVLGINSNRVVSAIKPGVTGETGIETKDIIKGIIDKIKPDFVVVIDSLKSSTIKRLTKTIQITDTGIHPGSGVNNKRDALDKKSLGIPVIAVGIPTVCDLSTIVNEFSKSNKKIPNMIVTLKEIDFVIDKLSDLLSICINEVIHDIKL